MRKSLLFIALLLPSLSFADDLMSVYRQAASQ